MKVNEIMNISGIRCYEENGTAYLNLEDVARGLGFTRVATSGNEVIRWERVNKFLSEFGFMPTSGHEDFATRGKKPEYIPENIFFRLSMKAKNETAERFQATVADDILPMIRKHGAYMTPQKLEEVLLNPDTLIKLATDLKTEREKRIALEEQAEQNKPKIIFADAVATSKNSILIGELAKILKQNGYNTGQNRLFSELRDRGYLIRRNGVDRNMPTQMAMELGLFEIKETVVSHSDGHTSINKTVKVTGKGQQYFINLFLKQNKDLPVVEQQA